MLAIESKEPAMTPKVSAFKWVPPFAQGYVRDLRVRWALEEAGLPYEATLIDREVQVSADYRDWQPFGQVPAYRDGVVEMFESGAIVLHIAARSEALAPADPAGQARVTTWVIAALNSVEPHVQNFVSLDGFHAGEAWTIERRPELQATLERRLTSLGEWLGEKDYLEGRFTAGDLIMTTVLRELTDSAILARFPALDAYRARCEARPAFTRALEAQLAPFRENASG
jgi:glutathione S-transferase